MRDWNDAGQGEHGQSGAKGRFHAPSLAVSSHEPVSRRLSRLGQAGGSLSGCHFSWALRQISPRPTLADEFAASDFLKPLPTVRHQIRQFRVPASGVNVLNQEDRRIPTHQDPMPGPPTDIVDRR
jgi:hypothetical protein